MNCGPPDQLPPSFLNLNWEQTNPNLVGQLGSLSNAEMISPQSQYIVNPMNSPPNLNLSMMGHLHHHHQQPQGLMPISENPMPATQLDQLWPDPGFVERAAKFSSFDGRNYPEFASNSSLRLSRPQVEFLDCGNVTQLHGGPQPGMSNAEFGNAQEESSVSDTVSHAGEVSLRGPFMKNARKRKVAGKGKGKETSLADSTKESFKVLDEKDLDAKRCRSEESNGTEKDVIKPKLEQNGSVSANEDGDQKQCKDNNSKLPEPPKDYIHVRARRGQATDSHSLAERVRREKISQRMKLLQDLVPGCNKVTGKAVMLDEIINYVQSLQRQVEFLSMKLATVNPQLDFSNLPNLLPKDMHQSCNPLLESVFPLETSGAAFSYGNQPQQGNPLHAVVTSGMESQCSMNPLDSTICQTINTHPLFHNGISDVASHQLGNFWDNDL